jgi:hypothetical protein
VQDVAEFWIERGPVRALDEGVEQLARDSAVQQVLLPGPGHFYSGRSHRLSIVECRRWRPSSAPPTISSASRSEGSGVVP